VHIQKIRNIEKIHLISRNKILGLVCASARLSQARLGKVGSGKSESGEVRHGWVRPGQVGHGQVRRGLVVFKEKLDDKDKRLSKFRSECYSVKHFNF
jgi:hypothetical protein